MVKRGRIMRDKQASEMVTGTIVTTIIAILLLVLLIAILTGGFKNFREKIAQYSGSSNIDSVINACNTLALSQSNYEFCCVNKTIKTTDKTSGELSCFSASNETWGKEIQKVNCEGIC